MSHSNLPPMGSVDPLLYLYSSDSEGQVDTIRVNDEGSKPQYVNVDLQGVPTSRIINIEANIMIMGGELFKKVATTARLKKKDFCKPDCTPNTYDRKTFQSHGKMELEITFAASCFLWYISRWMHMTKCCYQREFAASWVS